MLTSTGLSALIKDVRERVDKAGALKPGPAGSSPCDAVYARRRGGAALRTLYAAQKNVEAYLALTEETGLTAAHCLALATMLVARRKTEDALMWVERGIKLGEQAPNTSMAEYELSKLKRDLLVKLVVILGLVARCDRVLPTCLLMGQHPCGSRVVERSVEERATTPARADRARSARRLRGTHRRDPVQAFAARRQPPAPT